MKIGSISCAFAAVTVFYGVTAIATEPPVVFVGADGQQAPLTVDAQTMKRLRELIPPAGTNAAKQVPLRLDCAAIGRLRQEMRNANPPKFRRAAPATANAGTADGAADLKHQQRQTREWLEELDRRFECGPRKSEQR